MADTNMAELFARDPHEHSDEDINLIIKTLRENRAKFIADGGKPKAAPKQPTQKEAALKKLDLDIEL